MVVVHSSRFEDISRLVVVSDFEEFSGNASFWLLPRSQLSDPKRSGKEFLIIIQSAIRYIRKKPTSKNVIE